LVGCGARYSDGEGAVTQAANVMDRTATAARDFMESMVFLLSP
jgi:hypothetical protein